MPFLDDVTLPGELTMRMIDAAQVGAREALRNRTIGLRAEHKSKADGDIVTQGDQASQAAIFSLLPDQVTIAGRPETMGFFGEEAMHEGYIFPQHSQWRWCVDPIDGTKPYYQGDPYWSVSLALQRYHPEEDRWDSEAGVIYRATAEDTPEVLQGKVYWAEKGRGAFALAVRPGKQVRLSRPDTIQPLVEFEARPEVSTPQTMAYAQQALGILESRGLAHGFRRSICHSVCEMLEGEKSAVVQGVAGPYDWDIAAISLIVAEAGMPASFAPRVNVDGHWRYPAIMAWDEELFSQLLAIRPEV